jgi:choline dehydrogenase
VDFDVVVVGGGTAGCVLAARLSESPDRRVCLLEAGPDYGPFAEGRWPPEILDPRALAATHDWGPGGEDDRTLGARVLGGSSAHNACMIIVGSPADYDEWGPGWSFAELTPYLERARVELGTAPANTDRPVSFHVAFLEAAQAAGFPRLSDPNDPNEPVGVAPFPANVSAGQRWNAAFAYLDPARVRPNLTIVAETLVDRVELDGARATGVVAADGRRFGAATVVLTAGAYFTPAILLRSGIGPGSELRSLGIPVVSDLPIGRRLLDHCGTSVHWELSPASEDEAREHAGDGGLFEPHVVLKAASSRCPPETWDLHLLSWIYPTEGDGRHEGAAIVFHMKPLSVGRVRLRSRNPLDAPLVERGFLSREEDLLPLLEGIELARSIARHEPLRGSIVRELAPGNADPESYVRETIRNYFHPAGTCPLGAVLDSGCRVLGVDGLVVADASIMPTIPRANTNLTTAAIAERVSELYLDTHARSRLELGPPSPSRPASP